MADAKARLSELITRAAAGEPIRITKRGKPVAEINTVAVRAFLTAQGYKPAEVDLGRLEVTDQFARDSGAQLGGIRSAVQGSFEILGRDEVGYDPSSQVFKKIRVVTTVSYALK